MKKILELIKEYDTIIINGHIRPDGDCIGSQYGLKYLIEDNFPDKSVYISGDSSEYVSFIGRPEIISDDRIYENALSIAVDCPVYDRLSDNRCDIAKYSIKIDHHYDSEKYTDYEYVDPNVSSCTSIIAEMYLKFKDELMLTERAATALYVGLLTDTGRFTNSNVNSKTFFIASELVKHNVDIMYVNNSLSLETEASLRLKGYCLNNFKITENGFAYIVLRREEIEKFGVGDEVASSLVSSLSNLKDSLVWALIVETKENIRIRLRSRGPEINELASDYNGGGHKMASGGRLNSWDDLNKFIETVDELVKNYKISLKN